MAPPTTPPLPPIPPAAGPSSWRRFLPLGAVLAALAAFFALGLDRQISYEALAANRQALNDLVAAHRGLALLAFIAVYAGLVAVSVPGATVMTLAGGFLFGTLLGGAAVVVAATLGAVAIFLVARTALGDGLRRRAGPWLGRLEEGFRENAVSYMLVLRLVPLFPFFLVNLVPAFLGVRLRDYAVGTFVGIMPGSFVYASVGAGLGTVFDAGRLPGPEDLGRIEYVAPLVGLALLSLLPVLYRRLRRRSAPTP
ncbi:TVP38/TMEM64 family protein [Rhodospirillum centenum]|uniref:TVP38/TMEM64 family membrane protein n=1 Tax=Rhodospirillum centenum (strain ATCC 51521 / SW) TaxID=414684 RepID=B6IPG5_RHOCS|nr:TVP38/TMEM64 family protein [Rhodospirillum centenum]ACI99667.1 mercuric reductase, putative [Rhodospirillum centenum SW]